MTAQSQPRIALDMGGDGVVKARPKNRRRLLMAALPALIGLGAGVYWLNGGRYETTDNAYFHQARISIASDLSGRLVSVNVTDGQLVQKGATMFTVDPEPYRLALTRPANAWPSSGRARPRSGS